MEYPKDFQAELTDNPILAGKTCHLATVDVYPAFSGHQIALRENTHELRYFGFNQWAVRPEHNLINLLADFFDRYKVFAAVYTPAVTGETDYTIRTRVYSLEVIKERNDFFARLSVEYILVNNQNREVIHTHRAERRILLEDRDLNLFSAAVSEIFVDILVTFLESIPTGVNEL